MSELESQRFRVATYNVLDPGFGTLAPWDVRRSNIIATIETVGPSIIALQEAGWTRLPNGLSVAEDISAVSGLVLSPASFSGDAILFDPRIWSAGESGHVLLPRGRGDRRRSMIWQYLDHQPSGTTCLVVATHLSHGTQRNWARNRQMRRLVRRIRSAHGSELPTVVMGDFNSWDGRARRTPLHVLQAGGYREAIPSAHLADGVVLGTVADSHAPHRLDHIAVSAALSVVEAAVADPELPGPASDHRLVWADLELIGRPL